MTVLGYFKGDSALRYALFAVALTCLWAIIERLAFSIAYRYPLPQLVVMRYAVQLALLAAICLPTRPQRLLGTKRLAAQLGRGVCMFVMPLSFIFAGTGLSSPQLWATFWVAPILVLVLAWLWLGERVKLLSWAVVAVGYVGAILVIGQAPALHVAAVSPLISAASLSIYLALSQRLRDENIEASLFYTSIVVLLCMLPFALPYWRAVDLDDLGRIVAIGIIGLLLLTLLDRSVERVPASLAAPLLYGAVIWEAIVALLRDGKSIQPEAILGGALLFCAAAVVLIDIKALRYDSER